MKGMHYGKSKMAYDGYKATSIDKSWSGEGKAHVKETTLPGGGKSTAMKAKKLNYILQDSGARALITHGNKTRIVTEALKDAPELEHIIWCAPKDSNQIPKPTTHNSQPTTPIFYLRFRIKCR